MGTVAYDGVCGALVQLGYMNRLELSYMYQTSISLPIGSRLKRLLGMRGGGSPPPPPPPALGAGGPMMMSSRSSREETLLLWKKEKEKLMVKFKLI